MKVGDKQIDKMNKLEVVTFILQINPLYPIFTRRCTTKQLREQAKKLINKTT